MQKNFDRCGVIKREKNTDPAVSKREESSSQSRPVASLHVIDSLGSRSFHSALGRYISSTKVDGTLVRELEIVVASICPLHRGNNRQRQFPGRQLFCLAPTSPSREVLTFSRPPLIASGSMIARFSGALFSSGPLLKLAQNDVEAYYRPPVARR